MTLASKRELVNVRTSKILVGSTAIDFDGSTLPEVDANVTTGGVTVEVKTPERKTPVNANTTRAIVSSNLRITKNTNDDADTGIYEVTAPISEFEDGESGVGAALYVKFQVNPSTWNTFSPGWCSLTDMACPFFQLEYGPLNTALSVLFRDNSGDGSLVVGGPEQTAGSARPDQAEVTDSSFPWFTLADGTTVHLWIVFDLGESSARVYAAEDGQDFILMSTHDIGDLSVFPVAGQHQNFRAAASNVVRAYFGNAGRVGDVLDIEDWFLLPYTFFPVSITNQSLSGTGTDITGNSPVQYKPLDRKEPDADLGGWYPFKSGTSVRPVPKFVNKGGFAKKPHYLKVTREDTGEVAYARKIDQFDESFGSTKLTTGAMIEMTARATIRSAYGISSMMGIELDDGADLFRALILDDGQFCFLIDPLRHSLDSGYSLSGVAHPLEIEHTYRLLVDKLHDEICLFVDDIDTPETILPLSAAPAFGTSARALFGHILNVNTDCDLEISRVFLAESFRSWDGRFGILPQSPAQDSRTRMSLYSPVDWMDGDQDSVRLNATGSYGSRVTMSRIDNEFCSDSNAFVDFRMMIVSHSGADNERGAIGTTGVEVDMGFISPDPTVANVQSVRLLFVNAGAYGRKACFAFEDYTDSDFTEQTANGRKYSIDVDWTDFHSYRILYRTGVALELYIDDFETPAMQILWGVGGFGLSTGFVYNGLELGHIDGSRLSDSEWMHIRWGSGYGVDVGMRPEFPASTLEDYLLNGKSIIAGGATETALLSYQLSSSIPEGYSISDSDTLLVSVDGGGAQTVTFTGTAARLSKTGLSLGFPLSGTLVYSIDGDRNQTVTITAAADYADLAAQVDAGLSNATATDNSSTELHVDSEILGSTSSVSVVDGTLLSTIYAAPDSDSGTGNMPNLDDASADEVASVISSALTGASALRQNSTIIISSDTGLGGTIVVTGGTAQAALGF